MEISKTKAALYATLSSKKMRNRHGMFIVEGEKCVLDTLGAFDIVNILATPEWFGRHENIVSRYSDILLDTQSAVLAKISALSSPPEVMAVFRIPKDTVVPDLSGRLVLVLDGIQDPGNLGTIIRTADWFGVDVILASTDTVDIYNPKTIQSTMGSLKRVKVYYTSLQDVLRQYPDMPVYGTLLNGENIFNAGLSDSGFIIMGNEGNGISEEIRKFVTHPLLIPPYRKDSHGESLNVAIATAITLSTFRNY